MHPGRPVLSLSSATNSIGEGGGYWMPLFFLVDLSSLQVEGLDGPECFFHQHTVFPWRDLVTNLYGDFGMGSGGVGLGRRNSLAYGWGCVAGQRRKYVDVEVLSQLVWRMLMNPK